MTTELENLPKTYAFRIKVLSPDSSRDRQIKPSCAMKYFQELSDCHCAAVGNDYQTLKDRDMAFISVRTSLTFHRTPKWCEMITCETWHREMKGTQWIRDCVMKSDDGQVLVESTTGWILMNLTDRKVCRPNKVPGLNVVTAPELALQNDRLGRMKMPEEMPLVAERPILYSDIDYFGHLNNCVYADIICDYMPGSMTGREMKKLDISFVMEAVQGDTLKIHALEQDGKVYFTGYHDRGKCFDAIAEVAPIEG
ncbi:MAG: thioesterase [Oscillospiraceae bacterium]|nr:thioesterase [Oscillospiraceae bacterium]